MTNKKIKISNILESQIPDFIGNENPLFLEFLKQYYISEEHDYGNINLCENIPSYKNISSYSSVNVASFPIKTVSEILSFDETILVNSTIGFPNTYGLLKIDDEIITYTGLTTNTFTGCVRGFSGISEIESFENSKYLTFTETEANIHAPNSNVYNLSFLFLLEFFQKYKYNFIPGFENRNFTPKLSIENILGRARDFYSSKGTDASLKILFKILYGKNVEILKPFDNTIVASDAEWKVFDNMIVESIFGNPINLKDTTIYQNSFILPTANGTVSNVEEVFLANKRYYKISFSKDTIDNRFHINNKTRVIEPTSPQVVTVDSTLGFPTSGNFYYLSNNKNYQKASYQSKSHNQFFGCSGLTTSISSNTEIINDEFVYGYENNNTNIICQMRVVGSISNVSTGTSDTKYFNADDSFGVKYLGEKVSLLDKKFNTWFHNNVTYVDTLTVDSNTNTITTKNYHFLHKEDNIDIIDKKTNIVVISNVKVTEILDNNKFKIFSGQLNSFGEYTIKKNLKYVNENLKLNFLLADIQNSFIDKDQNTYIAFSGFPSYSSIETTNRSKIFTSSSASSSTISINEHNFITGDKIYYNSLTDSSGITGISSGFYYIKKINNDNIKLALNKSNLSNNSFVFFNGSGNDSHIISPSNLFNKSLINQNNFRRILKTPKNSKNNINITGQIGVGVNGIELHSPIHTDSAFYGQLEKINILNNGNNYDITNPPNVSIVDSTGSGAEAYAHIQGNISEIILTSPGFDYTNIPSVTISGGNGIGAECSATLKSFRHSISFSDLKVNLFLNKIILDYDHKFLDGEEIIYTSNGVAIGIGSTNVGFSTSRLSNGAIYYVAKIDNTSFSIASTKERAIKKTELIDFVLFGNNTHTFTSNRNRKIIDKIVINNQGSLYSNNKIVINAQPYPPINREDIYKTFVGINTYDNYIYAKNHNFKNKDLVTYSNSDTEILGLSTSSYYNVFVIDPNKFKLSNAGSASSISDNNFNNKIYENLKSIGAGTHTFNYPEIKVNILGNTGIGDTIRPSYYDATAYAVSRGKIENIFISNGGIGYGVTDIINYIKEPSISLKTGINGDLFPIINTNGEIVDVRILNSGLEYTTPPILEIIGSGKYAKLKSNVSNGKITSIEIINSGKGYTKNETYIRVLPAGSGAIFNSNIHEWKINSVERYKNILNEEIYKGTLQIPSEIKLKQNKICSFYATKEIRKILGDNLDPNTFEELLEGLSHSPIIGWAYDGNPIYGPCGNAKSIPDSSGTGGIKRLKSSYELNQNLDNNLRPSGYPLGYFVDDYFYNGNGDLDEYNGRYLINSDFPNGTYAYFSTLDDNNNPAFPYITIKHYNSSDLFNYDVLIDQSDSYINTGEYKRNITPLGLKESHRNYPFLMDSLNSNANVKVKLTKLSDISSINVINPGSLYKVGDILNFSNQNSINCAVSEILGKNIISIATTEIINNNLKFSVLGTNVTAFSTSPLNFIDGDIVEISGISSSLYKNIEGIRIIGITSFVSSVSSAIGSTLTTGITTFISISEPPSNKNIKINDIIGIGSEKMLIININEYNNKYRVIRSYDNSVGSSHTFGKLVTKFPKEFTFNVNEKLKNKNKENSKLYYFDSTKSVGIGTTYSNVIVGTSGSDDIRKSIPPRSIYLPNHQFKTGDLVSYVAIGGTIFASSNSTLSPTFSLSDVGVFYCVKLSDEFIGLSTSKIGFSTSYIYFNSVSGNNHKLETIVDEITGQVKKTNVNITLNEPHNLIKNDTIKLNIISNKFDYYNFKFNSVIKKLVTNQVSFASTAVGVGTSNSNISIINHNYQTGDLVVYTATNPITPLENNGIYHIIKINNNTIKIAKNNFDVIKFPYENIGITSFGSGTHELAKINPKLTFYRGNNVSIAVSDTSLSGYDINFYTDSDFKSRYESKLIKKNGVFGDANSSTKINISIKDSLPEKLYYRIEGNDLKFTTTYPSSVNTEVPNYSSIEIVDSKINGVHKISGIGSTTFSFTLVGSAETTFYNISGLSTAYYSTNSNKETGGIHSIKIINSGQNISKLPTVSSIETISGNYATLSIESDNIGKILDVDITNQGLEFTNNKTLAPKVDSYIILRLFDILTLKNINIDNGGANYTSAPKTIAIGNPNILTKTSTQGNSVSKVQIISNDSGLSNNLRIIPTINSNGVSVSDAVSEFGLNTLFLRSPITGFSKFPFSVNDKIYVENVKITNNADGYNSSDYGYRYFVVTGINTTGGSESVTYSISGIGSTGGSFDPTNIFGRVIKSTDLAIYSPEFEKVKFIEGEKITQINGNAYGFVAKNGWDPISQTLKIINPQGIFEKNKIIVGNIGNYKSSIENIYEFDFDFEVNSISRKSIDWENNKGKLSFNDQRIHDNDYYQRFSYSIKSEIDYDTWKESVNSILHTSGFKNFSDLQILNGIGNTVKVNSDVSQVDLNVEIFSESSVYDRFYYDLASEDTDDNSLSKIIKFDSKVITDYNESISNKVLLLDDISPQFTGVTTTVGGGIIGITSFILTSSGNTVFNKKFESSKITTPLSNISINDHEFNTGENLIYSSNGGTPIGIVTMNVIGIGNTDILPSSIYAIKITKDLIKLAIGKTEAIAGIAITFSSAGVGTVHTLSVESELATTRCIISIDNIIQSPVSRKDIIVSLASSVGIGTTVIYLSDISKIQGKSLIKIENEIIKVSLVGIGSTNSLNIIRGQMGTVSSAHTVGAIINVLSGDYLIKDGVIYFSDPPYGPTGIGELTTRSTFSGRVFYRLDYSTNYIIDDISENFNSQTSEFNLKNNNQTISGITSSFGIILVNNIFQKPFYGDVGSILKSDYEIVGTGQSINFTGSYLEDLPRGGVINEFFTGLGSGYQPPNRAFGYAVVSSGGTIQSIGLSTGGSGYRFPPKVSIADTLGIGIGASIISLVTNGIVTSFGISNAGSGYTTSSPPIVIIDEPAPYTNLTLSGGTGTGAKMNVVVGTGGSIISFNLENRGYGYSIGDVLTLTQIPYKVGIGTSAFNITIKNRYQSKFSGWTLGQLLELDDFSNLFNGVRKSFLLTRTIVNKEYYSIVAKEGSGILLANNLLIFINNVLQKPNIDYQFTSGTRLKFLEAPKAGSKFKIYFYTGSESDYLEIDIDETIKPGDRIRLQKKDNIPSQEERIVYELIAADTLETQTYSGIGIITDKSFLRPIVWSKQKSDIIIDGEKISKERNYLEPIINPTTNIIVSLSSTDTKMYVKNTFPFFNTIDDLSQTLNDIIIVGIGTTAITEKIKKVSYNGDYGLIVGIGTSSVGIGTTSPSISFDIIPHPNISTDPPLDKNISSAQKVTRSGISTGDYFVIENTTIGNGTTSIKNNSIDVVSIGNSFIDNIYYANHVVSIGTSTLRVYSNVFSISGINTGSNFISTSLNNYGTYTWGSINISRSLNSKSFQFNNQNGVIGIETSAHVSRILPLRLSY